MIKHIFTLINQSNLWFLKYSMFAALFVFASFASFAQVEEGEKEKERNEEQTEQRIEKLAEDGTEDGLDYTDLLDQLEYLKRNPINLNRTTADELKQIPFLTDIQINNLLNHIKNNGKLASIYEIQTVEGFTEDVINKILPYVYVSGDVKGSTLTFKEIMKNTKGELFLRAQRTLEEQKGYTSISDSALQASPNSRYLGSPERLYTRFRLKYNNNLSLGFTAEKDPGEEFFKGTQKNGFDFYTAHFFIKDMWGLKALALGDYLVQFGQGLTMWTGLGFGKSSDAVLIKKSPLGLKAFASANENLFMRGGAATVGFGSFEVTGFYSNKNLDANVQNADTLANEDVFVSSFDESGSHATPSELAKKDALHEVIFGGHVAYKTDRLNIGATFSGLKYGTPIEKDMQLYKQYNFSGDENTNIGVDYNYVFRNINFFGEVSHSENGGMAYLNGLLVSVDPKVTFSILHRDYSKDFQSYYSSGFAEGSSTANEKGIYFGMETKFNRRWIFNAYVDNFWFPWLTSSTCAPSKGVEYLGQLEYIPSKKVSMSARFKIENKQITGSSESSLTNSLQTKQRQNYRYHISYQVSPQITLKNRFEFVRLAVGDSKPSDGYLLYQDLSYAPVKSPFTLTMRYAIFNTDSYDAAIYAYESDVLYAYSIPSYYYKGSKGYIVLRYSISRNLDLWVRYARTLYLNKSVISSGLTEIQGSHKSEVKVQLRLKF